MQFEFSSSYNNKYSIEFDDNGNMIWIVVNKEIMYLVGFVMKDGTIDWSAQSNAYPKDLIRYAERIAKNLVFS